MIRSFEVKLNAAHPELPLFEATAIVGSASTAFIKRVPASIGSWHITKVYVNAQYPDGSNVTIEAQVGAEGIWTATLPATETSGRVRSGFSILADGIDENGDPITQYILGIADFAVYTRDLKVQPGSRSWVLKYFDVVPDPAKKGDVAKIDDALKLYDGTQWVAFGSDGDLSDYYTKEETDALFDDYYTKQEADEAIDRLAAYYITYTAAGAAFPTRAALLSAETYYSGGVARVPTRNDYAVVLADESHSGAEYRYIYAVADGQTTGQWEAQYPIETNDYTALSNKPKINNVELAGNKSASDLGLATSEQGAKADAALPKSDVVAPLNTATAGKAADARATGEALTALSFSDWYPNGSVTSVAEFTSGIKYDFDEATGTAAVRPFFNTGNPDNDNSTLVGRVVIPPYVDYNGRRYAVTSIAMANSNDRYNTVLTDIVAPITVTTIGSSAINRCTALKTVYFPGVTSAGASAFGGSSVEEVQMPKLQTMGRTAFYNCTALKKISLPSLVSAGEYAFGYTPLEEVSMPKRTGFALTEFYQCGSLKKVYSPAITNLPYTVFESCSSLEVIDFGNELATVPTLTSTTFDNAHACLIVVPDALYSEWTTATYWKTLPSRGFRFLKHSEWECARGYTVDDKLAQKQAKITASGILKGDGAGGVSAAVPGTDYQAPLTFDNVPTANSNNPVKSGGVYTALQSKADVSALRYALGETITATATLADRTNNKVIPAANNTSDIKLYFPAATGGKARDFIVTITNTTGNTGKILFKVPSGASVYGDAFKEPIASGETWIYSFTEISVNEFFAKAQKVEDPYKALYWGLYFEAEEDGAEVSMSKTGSPSAVSLETSTDGATWTTFDAEGGTTPITLAHTGDRVYFRAGSGGNTVFASGDSNYHAFTLSKKCGAYGNIMSLLADNSSNTTISANGAFRKLFFGCDNLTAAPTLAATTITSDCYGSMFKNCTSLEAAPLLPATTLADGCYAYMFEGCTALVDVPPLPAMTMAGFCCYCMFRGCSALTTAPALPATTMANGCYGSMFKGCSNLTVAPSLPATTLAAQCYMQMFEECGMLVTGPDIKATTLGLNSLGSMFWNCRNLNSIKVAFTTWDGTGTWMINVQTNSGTFYCPAALGTNETITRGTSNCPDNWTVVNV